MVQQLAGKVAYVTGAASGIGKAIADLYAQQGAKVVIADLKQEAAEAAAKDIESKGGTAMGVAVDVTQEDQVDASVEAAVKAAEATVGAPIKVTGFVRFALGEGIDKGENDFAAEVAAAAGQG